jgi:hypothetical protein
LVRDGNYGGNYVERHRGALTLASAVQRIFCISNGHEGHTAWQASRNAVGGSHKVVLCLWESSRSGRRRVAHGVSRGTRMPTANNSPARGDIRPRTGQEAFNGAYLHQHPDPCPVQYQTPPALPRLGYPRGGLSLSGWRRQRVGREIAGEGVHILIEKPLTRPAPAGESAGSAPPSPRGRGPKTR